MTPEALIRRALENAAASRKAIEMQSKLLPVFCRRCRRMHAAVLVWQGRERPYHEPPARRRAA